MTREDLEARQGWTRRRWCAVSQRSFKGSGGKLTGVLASQRRSGMSRGWDSGIDQRGTRWKVMGECLTAGVGVRGEDGNHCGTWDPKLWPLSDINSSIMEI